ncbi:hypothetical protein, partial [Enterococcus plantarum]|uniref:hypothetical protein n=1 Tax=Enterococcus plantarum TaxID=1077675 RepID=UPI001C650E40
VIQYFGYFSLFVRQVLFIIYSVFPFYTLVFRTRDGGLICRDSVFRLLLSLRSPSTVHHLLCPLANRSDSQQKTFRQNSAEGHK